MNLKEYLFENDIEVKDFAEQLGVDRVTLHYWISGHRRPNERNQYKIMRLTDGKVKGDDWRNFKKFEF